MRRIIILFAAGLFVLSLAGCKGQVATQPGADAGTTAVRGDIDTDICHAITADFVYSATDKPVVKVEPDWILPGQACRYYFSYDPDLNAQFTDPRLRGGGQMIFMMVENLSVENQKKGLDILEASYDSNPRIGMENMVTYRKDKTMRDIRLIINPNRYVRIETNSGKSGLSDDELVNFAAKVAEKIQGKLSFEIKKNPIALDEPADEAAGAGESQQPLAEQFWKDIGEKNIDAALRLMDVDENTRSAWRTNFNNLESLKLSDIEPAFKDEWTAARQTYKATLEVKAKPAGMEMGWQNGTNYRWLTLVKKGDGWVVSELASNP